VCVSLYSGESTAPFNVTIRMGNIERHFSHIWTGPCSGSTLGDMIEVYSGPVHGQQKPVELIYPKALQDDVTSLGEKWVKAIGAVPKVQLGSLENFNGLVIKCPQVRSSYLNAAVPLTMTELFASVERGHPPKINTLSQALAHGVQILPTHFNPAVVTQIFANEDIFRPVYTQISGDPATSKSESKSSDTKPFVATAAGVYIHGEAHAVLPGKHSRESESKACLDHSWGSYPSTGQQAGLIMKSTVTHVVPHRGGALLLLADGCHFPTGGEFRMTGNFFPEILRGEWFKFRRLCDFVNHTVVPEKTDGTPLIGAWAGDRLCVWVKGKQYEVVNDLMWQTQKTTI